MHKFFYISLLFLFFIPDAMAQDKKYIYRDSSLLQQDETDQPTNRIVTIDQSAEETVSDITVDAVLEKPDTSLYLNELLISTDSVAAWKKRKEFAYMNNIDSLLKARANKKKDVPSATPAGRGFFNNILNSSFLQFFFWTAALAFVLFIVYRLFLAEGVFKLRTMTIKNGDAEVEEEIINEETDFDAMIRQALQNNNHRQAVRYQYLRTLHTLAGKKFITLSPDKTNYQYVRELSNRDHQNDFASLTLNYEYVWYGEFSIDQILYQKIETGFTNLNKKLQNLI